MPITKASEIREAICEFFCCYLFAVCRHYFLAGGGAVIGTLILLFPNLYQGIRVSGLWLVFILIFVASFLAWREERDKATSTSGQLDELKQTFGTREQEWKDAQNDKTRLHDRIAGLSNLWTKGKMVLKNLNDSDVSFDLARKAADDWMLEVCIWMDANWGKAHDLNLFKRNDEWADQIPDHFPQILRERNSYCRGIEIRLRTLRTIIERESSKLPS